METGTQLGHYTIDSLIGKGGMGEVYQAKDEKLGRQVAIKVLPEEFAKDADRLARFEREAKLLASLNHPNIAAIYGLEEHNATRFLVLELVEGDTLADRLNRGAIPVEESLKLALQIADALKATHDSGVIHRDLKPANINVTDDDKVKVLDFGLAKAFAGEQEEVTASNSPTLSMAATQQGMILGTAAYMSPEQAKGRTVDKRADVWAFGCVLYEMLTGRQSFGASDVTESLAAVIRADPKWDTLPANLHPRLREAVERCLEKSVAKRFQDIGDVKVDIAKVLADPDGVLMRPVAEAVRTAPQSKLPWVVAFVLGGIIASVAAWNLKPSESHRVSRSEYALPEGRAFRRAARPVLTFSSDGSQFVYNATGGLHLRSLDELESRVISGTEGILDNPTFSPNGEWIVYWSPVDTQLQKIATVGGAPVSLTEVVARPFGISWEVEDTILYGGSEGAMRVSADGGEPEVLVPRPAEAVIGAPQLLPGGDAVLFVLSGARAASTQSLGGQVAVQSLDSEEPKILFPGERPRYVPTGHLVYAQQGAIFAVPFDSGSLEVTGGPVPLVQGVGNHYAVSDSGSLVYVPGRTEAAAAVLALVDRDGGTETLEVPARYYVGPRLSPDGTRLAVEVTSEDGSAIFVYDLSGSTAMRRLTQTSEGSNRFPLWTPDGERVTFTSDRDGLPGIYWQSADGTDVAESLFLAEEDTSLLPTGWSPDGRTLAFAQGRTPLFGLDGGIWTLSLDGGAEAEPILFYDDPDSAQLGATFSPDGNWIAYRSGEAGSNDDVYVQPFPPTGRTYRVTEAPVNHFGPLWSADGTELFYQQNNRMFVVDVGTTGGFQNGPERTLAIQGFLAFRPYRDYDVMPDSQRFLVAFSEGQTDLGPGSQINIVLNWFEELTERVPVL